MRWSDLVLTASILVVVWVNLMGLERARELVKAAEKYGSAPGTIAAVNRYNDVKEINVEVEGKKAEFASSRARK